MSYGDFNKNTVVGEGDLASQLTCLQPFGLFSVGRLWIKGQGKVSDQIQGSDPEDKGGDGVPRQGHRGEGLHDLQVQDRDFFTADGSFIEYVDCQYKSLLNFFYFNKIGWFVPFKRKKKKNPDLSLPPCR